MKLIEMLEYWYKELCSENLYDEKYLTPTHAIDAAVRALRVAGLNPDFVEYGPEDRGFWE